MKNRLLPMLVALLIGVVFVAAVPKSVFADDSVTTFIPQAVIDGQSKAGLDIYIGYCYTTATDGFNAPYGALKNNGNPTSENIGNGDWFNTGFGTTHGSPSNIQKAADTVVREQILGWKNNETLWCDNLNKAGTTGTGTGLLDKANDMFGWGGMVQGACKLGLVRQNNSSCVSGDGDFKRGNWTAQATTTDTSPSFDSNAASYVRGYLSCVYNGGTPNFVKVSTASADTKATQKYTYSTVTLSNDKATVEQVYDTGSGNCGAQSHGGNNAQAYADWLNANPAMLKQANASVATKNDPINGQGKAVCTGGSLGWILCPLTDMASNMINSLAGLIQSLLTYQPLLGSTQGATIQKIWSIVVGIANLLLIVAFLIVIFSQATSIGLSAYGIKKMLPRIIAAAILINLSFFICALAVDLSNIIGASVQGIIQSASAQLPAASGVKLAAEPWNIGFVALTTTLIAGTFVTGAIFYIFPFLLTAALTLLTAFVVLAVRQILITLLIIVAPLAFAAFVLPNTEDLYKKWQKLFVVLLVMYPLVMFIFYGSSFMSQLILMTKDQTQSGANQFFTDVIAFIMLFVPLFILPTLMKLAGGILERFGGIVNDRSKGLIDRNRKWAGEKQGRSTWAQTRALNKSTGNTAAQRRAIERLNSRKGILGRAGAVGAYGISGAWGGKGITPYARSAGSLLATNAADAVKQINDKEVATHAAMINRRAAEVLSGHDGMSYRDGKVFQTKGGVTSDITSDFDQGSMDSLTYAAKNNLLDSKNKNGIKGIATSLYESGGMTTQTLDNLTSMYGKDAGDKAEFVAFGNAQAGKNGLTHLKYNTVDNKGKLNFGGVLPPKRGVTGREIVAKKVVESGLHNISKDSWGDGSFSAEWAKALYDYELKDADQFDSDMSKMNDEQFEKMIGTMGISPIAAAGYRTRRNAARKS